MMQHHDRSHDSNHDSNPDNNGTLDRKTLEQLEYSKIRSRLVAQATNSLGKGLAGELWPSTDIDEVHRRQRETGEALSVLTRKGTPPLGGIHDLDPYLQRAVKGSVIEPSELLEIIDTLEASTNLRNFFQAMKEEMPGYQSPIIDGLLESIGDFKHIVSRIVKCINDSAEIKDSASPKLSNIRKEVRTLTTRARSKLNEFISSDRYRTYLQDELVTLRGDRYVVPVKRENREMVPGVVHDRSSSGATLFIEPMAVVDINNQLREVELAERQEELRILHELAAAVADEAPGIRHLAGVLGRLDFIFAKGKLAQEMQAVEPKLNNEGRIDIRTGRHPLLTDEVVPVDIPLGVDFNTMVITGPNTGGKTVTLKTAGLFTAMCMAGLHVPAAAGSELCVFKKVFSDIGDEQSIEQSLSTFSSHMTNIIRILTQVDGDSLVLIDEVGAGTDPNEGAALAMALLETLHNSGARTIATTHYGALKRFAWTSDGIVNASVEFDVATLQPTYRLAVGLPGKSNALAIAGRLGLDQEILHRTRELMGSEQVKVEDLIEDMSKEMFQLSRDRRQAEETKSRISQRESSLEHLLEETEERKRKVLEDAHREATEILQSARAKSEDIIKRLRRLLDRAATAQVPEVEGDIQAARGDLREVQSDLQAGLDRLAPLDTGKPPQAIAEGDRVYVKSLRQDGTVLSEPQDGQVQVQIGIMKATVALADLRPARGKALDQEKPIKKGHEVLSPLLKAKAARVSSEIHLRGMTVEEGLTELEGYLDDAFLGGIPQARIVHGKGTGTLRRAVREYLNGHPYVASYRDGEQGEGGFGVTVVEFKAGPGA